MLQDFKETKHAIRQSVWRSAWNTIADFCFAKAEDEDRSGDNKQLTLFEMVDGHDVNAHTKSAARYSFWRTGSAVAAFTFCFCLLGAGFILVDYNTRRMGMGDASLRLDIVSEDSRIMINLLGRERAIEISDTVSRWAGRAYALLPPAWRCIQWLYEVFCSLTTAVFG